MSAIAHMGRRPPPTSGKAAPERPEPPKPPREPRPAATPAPARVAPTPGGGAAAAAPGDKKRFLRIDNFEGIYDFLSLEAPCNVALDGVLQPSAGHAILAAQFPGEASEIAKRATLEDARKAVEGASEVDGWKELTMRLRAMGRVQRDKFRRHEEYRTKLKDTGDRELVWTNREDSFWGMTKGGQGSNHLGRILQEVRESILNDTEFEMWLHVCCEIKDDASSPMPIQLQETKTVGSDEEHIALHRLTGKTKFTLGKVPANDIVALHPSVSRKHAMILHTKAGFARKTGEVVLLDLGSKAGTTVDTTKLDAPYMMVPLRQGSIIRLGASTRTYKVTLDFSAQIRALEEKERELMQECRMVETEMSDPVAVAKKKAKEASTVWVGNLDFETTEADLKAFFRDCGEVVEVRMPGKRLDDGPSRANAQDENASRGFAFVVLGNELSARRAVSLAGMTLNERKVNIRIAEARDNRPDAGGGKGGGKDGGKGGGKGGGKDMAGRAPEISHRSAPDEYRSARDEYRMGPQRRSRSRSRTPAKGRRRSRDRSHERGRSGSRRRGQRKAQRRKRSSSSSS